MAYFTIIIVACLTFSIPWLALLMGRAILKWSDGQLSLKLLCGLAIVVAFFVIIIFGLVFPALRFISNETQITLDDAALIYGTSLFLGMGSVAYRYREHIKQAQRDEFKRRKPRESKGD